MEPSLRIPSRMRITIGSRIHHPHYHHIYTLVPTANVWNPTVYTSSFYNYRTLATATSSTTGSKFLNSPNNNVQTISPLTAVAEGLTTSSSSLPILPKASLRSGSIPSNTVHPSSSSSSSSFTVSVRSRNSSLPVPSSPASSPASSSPLPPSSAVSSSVWFDLHEGLRLALHEMNIKYPSDIQQIAIPSLLQGQNVLLTAATGTGKTLTYLLPIIHRLKLDEDMHNIITRPQRPRVLIITPTRELTLQVGSIVKKLSHTTKFSSYVLVGGRKDTWQKESLKRNMDILVTTVGKLQQALEKNWLSLRDIRYLCIDEADTLLNEKEGFMDELKPILQPILYTEKQQSLTTQSLQDISNTTKESIESTIMNELQKLQIVLAGATMPHTIQKMAQKLFPSLVPINANSTHRLPHKLDQRFIRVGGEADAKHNALMETLRKVIAPTYATNTESDNTIVSTVTTTTKGSSLPRILIFCNTLGSARSTAYYLGEQGYTVTCLHGGIPPKLRQKEYELFTSGKHRIMVCTDAAARGLDFPGLTMVINFDFPLNPIEYIHRAGRVARAGRSGLCVNLVLRKDTVLATSIERAKDKDDDVAILSSNKLDYVPPSQKAVYTATKEKRTLKHKESMSQQTRRRLVVRNRIDNLKKNKDDEGLDTRKEEWIDH